MSTSNRQGTFWVIDGVRVKKKNPYFVMEIDRVLNIHTPKNDKIPEPHAPPHEPTVPVGERYFFTEKSYEDFADKRMDYGMIRFSSLSSLKGDIFWGQHHEGQHNFSAYNSTDNLKETAKKTIFENQFSVFEYIDEESQE
jgi:hypothetical protein